MEQYSSHYSTERFQPASVNVIIEDYHPNLIYNISENVLACCSRTLPITSSLNHFKSQFPTELRQLSGNHNIRFHI